MKKIETGIYIRVSTEEQAKHGFSIAAQKEKLESFSNIKDWHIFKVYIDEGISGKNLERPQIKALLKDIKDQKINNVLVFKIDRLTRSTKDLIDLVEYFQKYNCDFNSLTEAIDTSSPTGRMFIKIIGLFAEFERETIVERIKIGLERKVKEGYSLCSSTSSLGYVRRKGNKVQEIDEAEAKVVKKIFSMCKADKTIKEIKNYLEENNIKTKKNKKWTNKNIINILTNPNYIGQVRYGINTSKYFEKEGKHQNIIDLDTYELVQEKINNRLRTKQDAYYSNKLTCMCHHRLSTKRVYINNKCYINYSCKNHSCMFKSISHNYLDNYLNLNKLSLIEKMQYVQTNIIKIAILSLKKDKLIVYKSVNNKNTNFTLLKK